MPEVRKAPFSQEWIHSIYLERHYSPPSLKGVVNIGIDEFAVRKGHIYKTIVVDLDTGRILYVGDGKVNHQSSVRQRESSIIPLLP